jgi:ornithine cyclodeaminase/alanine dehydrogenase-like protein (mu-crystallin family)
MVPRNVFSQLSVKSFRLAFHLMSDLHLSEADVRSLLHPVQLCAALEAAFRDRYPSISLPPRTHAELAHGIFLAMSCYDGAAGTLGMKLVLVRDLVRDNDQVRDKDQVRDQDQNHAGVRLPSGGSAANDNAALADGRIQATYLLLDPETAEPRLTIAANYLTDLRTAATSAVATKFLARSDASTLGIFGTGRLALAHLAVLPLARNFERVLICGRNSSRSAEFVQKVSAQLPDLTISAVDARSCAAQSDVICTCTSNSTPLFDGRDLRPGTHLNLVGAFRPETREVDTQTIARSRVIVDTYAAAAEVGELSIPLQEGAIGRDHVLADLHELISGKKQGRRNTEEITVFKSVGCALEDLVAAELLLDQQKAELRSRLNQQ